MKQLLNFIKELNKSVPGNVAALPQEDPFWRLVGNNGIATWVSGYMSYNPANPDHGWAELPLPWGGVYGNVIIGASIFGIPKYSKNVEAAKKFVSLYVSPWVPI